MGIRPNVLSQLSSQPLIGQMQKVGVRKMTKETRIVAGPEDVRTIGLACRNCEAERMVTTEEVRPFPDECPICGEFWRDDKRVEAAKMLISAIRNMNLQPSDKVHVRFVFDENQATNA